MSAPASLPNALAADVKSLDRLRYGAGAGGRASIQEAARQFESLFMRELIKSMREATLKSGLTDSAQGDLGADLLDQQLAVQMSGLPGGLSQSIERQLSQQMGTPPAGARGTPTAATLPTAGAATAPLASGPLQQQFVQSHQQAAAAVERSSGIPAQFMLGQAAHETGWGRRQINLADGSPSFNLFGIKAGPGWTGKVAQVTTTEYQDGQPRKVTAQFRAYDSYQASFEDYARLINQSPRYAQARQQTGSAEAFAAGLQKAGYATDPQYAAKLSRAINSTLRTQRLMA
jgi:peptidoglycan hydrolase FlgJ